VDSFTFQLPPSWAIEGGVLYGGIVLLASMFAGRYAGWVLLGGMAAGLGPLAALSMPRVALAVACVIVWVIVHRYGWRWVLAAVTYVATAGYLILHNIADLGPLQMASPGLLLAAVLDAVISATILWVLAVVAWFLSLSATGKLLLLVRSGFGSERSRRLQLACCRDLL